MISRKMLPELGVSLGKKIDSIGVTILSVLPNSTATTSDIQIGDIITRFGAYRIDTIQSLINATRQSVVGNTYTILLLRDQL